jgi:hypothetical protein
VVRAVHVTEALRFRPVTARDGERSLLGQISVM